MHKPLTDADRKVQELLPILDPLKKEIGTVLIGQQQLVERLLIGLLVGGHLLLEGVPGLAKTLAARTFAQCLDLSFSRIQFTPDLLPADVIGTMVYVPQTGNFTTKKGPIFGNIVLADEINRAPAKVQSALLEAMQERQVTIGDTTHILPVPFMVLATQNPIEQEGTYPLAEAQADRFLMKVKLDYPDIEEEQSILRQRAKSSLPTPPKAVIDKEKIQLLVSAVDELYVDPKIERYIVDLVRATRRPADYGLALSQFVQYGAGPRGTLSLAQSAKAYAFLQGRGYVTPADVKTVALDVLRHRVIVTYEAAADDLGSERLVQEVIQGVKAP